LRLGDGKCGSCSAIEMYSDDALGPAAERAIGAWPELSDASDGFEDHIRQAEIGPDDLELHGSELYLSYACARGHAAAIRILERRYLAATAKVVARVNSAPDFVDEVHQALLERLLVGPAPRIGQYAGTGSLTAWLRVSALRLALNQHKAHRNREELLAEAMTEPSAPNDGQTEGPRYKDAVQAALRAAFGTLTPRQRNVLRLHYLEALNVDQIGALYGVHRATAARWLARAREQIFDYVAAHVQKDLGFTVSEVRSVLLKVRSQLEISVLRLLGDEQEADVAGSGT
jgi:RNA polymerase sigma-70 factor (ECF subfamily)